MATGLVSTSWIYQQFCYVFCSACKLLMQHMNVQLLLDKYDFICASIIHIQLLLLSHNICKIPVVLLLTIYNVAKLHCNFSLSLCACTSQTRMFAVDYSSITMEREQVNLLRSGIWYLISDFISADRQSTYYFCLPCNSFLFSDFFLLFLFWYLLCIVSVRFVCRGFLFQRMIFFVVLITFN